MGRRRDRGERLIALPGELGPTAMPIAASAFTSFGKNSGAHLKGNGCALTASGILWKVSTQRHVLPQIIFILKAL